MTQAAGTIANESRASRFERDGYAPLPDVIPEALRSFLYEYALKSAEQGTWSGDEAFRTTPCVGGDPFMDTLLEMLLPRIESESERKLFPTYSYLRVYKRGDVLRRHSDRAACEISVTLNLGYRANEPWPVWIESHGIQRSCALNPGDALLYKGIELPHWREAFQGENCAQVFLHYVDQRGPCADWKFDKKTSLATSPAIRAVFGQLAGISAAPANALPSPR